MGIKIKLWCCTHDTQSMEKETYDPEELGFDVAELKEISKETEKELEAAARDFFYEEKQPEWGYELVDDTEA